jgi:hypothetical protein
MGHSSLTQCSRPFWGPFPVGAGVFGTAYTVAAVRAAETMTRIWPTLVSGPQMVNADVTAAPNTATMNLAYLLMTAG